MATKPKTALSRTLIIDPVSNGRVEFNLLGTSALIYNSMSAKSMQNLLVPPKKKNATERQGTLKHEPMQEFVASVYRHRDDSHPTRLFFPGGGFKGALKSAALRLPGVKKTEIAQLTWIEGRDVDVYGVPQIYMAPVRNADPNRTPDIRTRAILPQWCARVAISYNKPQLSDLSVTNLLANAGMLCGIGDGRQEKGYGFGMFEIVSDNDPRFRAIMKSGGRAAQDAALAKPRPYDIETEQLLAYFNQAVEAMGDRLTGRSKPTNGRSKPTNGRSKPTTGPNAI
jgi:hypothetical protein